MILVTGANGYVGGHLVTRLCGGGRPVRALVRRGCRREEKEFLSRLGAEVVESDVGEGDFPAGALRGVRTVVHLLGSIERPGRGGYRGMHTGTTRMLMRAFRDELGAGDDAEEGRGRIVYLSALGAGRDTGNLYHRTKWEAEEEIRQSGMDYIILRASLVFGRETGERDSKIVRKLVRLAMTGRTVPIIGAGRNRIQPVYIGDLVRCIEAAVNRGGSPREVWEIGGPRVLTLREIVETILRVLGLKRKIVGIPYPLALFLGVCARAAGREERINLEQVKMTRHDNLCAENRAPELCEGDLVTLEEGLKRTLDAFGAGAMAGR